MGSEPFKGVAPFIKQVSLWKLGNAGLQITVGHRTMEDQNLQMSDEIPTVVGQSVQTNVLC